MRALTEIAFAKINLALHVRERRADGYHELDTLFAFVDGGDVLSCVAGDTLSLNVSGAFGDALGASEDNLVLRTARVLAASFSISRGAGITLEKRLPVASGIGGGSADAAATARLLNELWGLNATEAELAAILAPIGADVPACVASQTARGRGVGTDLERLHCDISGMPVLLVNPNKALSTAAVFAAWTGKDRGGLSDGSVLDTALSGRNDLQEAAIRLCPDIADVLTSIEAQAPVLARMSGSGATCFGLFANQNERDTALQAITAAHPAWWTFAGTLR